MKNIIEELTNKAMGKLANEIDDYALAVFNIPSCILKIKWLAKLYAKFYGLTIENQRNLADLSNEYRFFKRHKKIGELKIKDSDLINFNCKEDKDYSNPTINRE